MTNDVSDVVGGRVREVRKRCDWTTAELAEQCASKGMPQLTASVLNDIETGRRAVNGSRRRTVSVDELLALALVLDVAPVHLLVPIEGDGQEPYQITPEVQASRANVRAWIRGLRLPRGLPLVGDQRRFRSEMPEEEFVAAWLDEHGNTREHRS